MNNVVVALALAVLVLGCGKNEAVKDMEVATEKVCACSDIRCAQDEMQKVTELIIKHKDTRGTVSDQKAIEALGQKMAECNQKLGKGGTSAPPAPPAAPPAAPAAPPPPPPSNQ